MVYAPSRWYTKQGNYSIYSSLFKLWLAKSIYAPHSVFVQLCKKKIHTNGFGRAFFDKIFPITMLVSTGFIQTTLCMFSLLRSKNAKIHLVVLKNYIKCYANEKERNSETKIEAIVAIEALCTFFAEQQVIGIVPKNTSSSCKRICMFLRWLVRNNSSVDLGIWHDFINKQSLIIPLDTHVLQQANRLKLLNTTSTNNVGCTPIDRCFT